MPEKVFFLKFMCNIVFDLNTKLTLNVFMFVFGCRKIEYYICMVKSTGAGDDGERKEIWLLEKLNFELFYYKIIFIIRT